VDRGWDGGGRPARAAMAPAGRSPAGSHARAVVPPAPPRPLQGAFDCAADALILPPAITGPARLPAVITETPAPRSPARAYVRGLRIHQPDTAGAGGARRAARRGAAGAARAEPLPRRSRAAPAASAPAAPAAPMAAPGPASDPAAGLPSKEAFALAGHEGAALNVRFNAAGTYCLSCGKVRAPSAAAARRRHMRCRAPPRPLRPPPRGRPLQARHAPRRGRPPGRRAGAPPCSRPAASTPTPPRPGPAPHLRTAPSGSGTPTRAPPSRPTPATATRWGGGARGDGARDGRGQQHA
jgi:hypothetical protein